MQARIATLLLAALGAAACKAKTSGQTRKPLSADPRQSDEKEEEQPSLDALRPVPGIRATTVAEETCGGDDLTIAFYDAGQALAALITTPDGARILIDTGESPTRPFCGNTCKKWHENVIAGLVQDLGDDSIDLVWITHQHSDHHGGLPGVAERFSIRSYIDNGQSLDKPGVGKARNAAREAGATISVIDPDHTSLPRNDFGQVNLLPVVPDQWPSNCESDPNDCSIGLLVTYCDSSILFTGDLEQHGEAAWPLEELDIDLLQVSHHGSDTSSTREFVDAVRPEYAVISCAKRDEGTNRRYCHPRQSTIERVSNAVGGGGSRTIEAFDARNRCVDQSDENWPKMTISDDLWITAIDGQITLTTTGNGVFTRVLP